MKGKIFYSWQSDSPASTNKSFIQDAALLAISKISVDADFEFEPSLDRDTQDIPGSPAIAQSILEKIEQCALFLCDVTIVTEKLSKRLSPNPNVLIELGYAAAKIGWERIICVMNEEFGGPSKLPFDLKHRRWPIKYRLNANSVKSSVQVKDKLSEEIELAIRTAILSGVMSHNINPKDKRVAIKFEAAISSIIGALAQFLTSHGYETGMVIINEINSDEPGSNYPSPTLVEPIMDTLMQNSLMSPSPLSINDEVLPWAMYFVKELTGAAQNCNRILDQYADRDDRLIELLDDISNKAKIIASMIDTCVNVPELSSLYEKGVPEVHADFFRYFLLAIIKSHRTIKEFQ